MNEFMKVLLSLSVSGSLLLLLVFLLRQVYKNSFSKCWQYYIWLAAALRFLIPFTLASSVTGHLFTMADAFFSRQGTESEWDGRLSNTGPFTGTSDEVYSNPVQPGYLPGESGAAQAPMDFSALLFFVWAAFVLVFFIRKLTIYQSFMRYVRAGNTEISDIETLNLLADCSEKLHIRKTVELYSNPLIASPIMAGLLRPAIILPESQTAAEDLSYIFTHELIHYKRLDMFYKWFIQLVICIHWFNPIVYLLGQAVNRDCELSCDEAVIHSLNEDARKKYGNTLLSFIKTNSAYKNSLASVTLTEGARQLKERLGAIMKYRKKSKAIIVLTALLTVLICIGFYTLGAYAKPGGTSGAPMKQLTAEDAGLLSETAGNIQSFASSPSQKTPAEDTTSITYIQRSYYQNSYIIEIGWNLSEKSSQPYSGQAEITLADKSNITVYFEETAKEYSNDGNALSAIGDLISSLKSKSAQPEIERPIVWNVIPVSPKEIPALAQQYFEQENLSYFSSLFPALDKAARQKYCEEIYNDDKLAFFSSITENLDKDLLLFYAEQSELDNKITFFSIILDYLPSEDLMRYAEKYYEENNIAHFSVLVDYMDRDERQAWYSRALADRKNTFCAVIEDAEELLD